jgi:hypothetical protein
MSHNKGDVLLSYNFLCQTLHQSIFQFQSQEKDVNHDGKIDEIIFELEVLLNNVEDVMGTTLFLLFDYKLNVII